AKLRVRTALRNPETLDPHLATVLVPMGLPPRDAAPVRPRLRRTLPGRRGPRAGRQPLCRPVLRLRLSVHGVPGATRDRVHGRRSATGDDPCSSCTAACSTSPRFPPATSA